MNVNFQDLFDCIAKELAKFISMHPDSNKDTASNEDKKLGLTLLYPANGSTSTSGSAIKWKSLSADDTVEFVYPFSLYCMKCR